MRNHNYFAHQKQNCHVNAFIDLNGLPYLLGEYLDNRNYQYLDKALIKSEINIDQSEAMRAVVDISIDDIGRKASDGSINQIGNNTKMHKLLKMISDNVQRFDHQLDTLRKGIVIRVNYQLENQKTQQVIRSMTEDLKIKDRNYFMSINSENINDNAIIVNFSDSIVSTINEFTHGLDRMILRITNIQMFYECVKRNPVIPNVRQTLTSNNCSPLQSTYGTEYDMYMYHNQMQNQHFMGYPSNIIYNGYGYEDTSCNVPPHATFNRFYHFDNMGKDMCLHQQEIYDTRNNVVLLSCGNVKVNRAFVINPGHRIIFKFCIWKNDLTIFNDTRCVAEALQTPFIDCTPDEGSCDHNHHCHHDHEINPDYETLIRLYHGLHETTNRQNCMINYLMEKINTLGDMIESLLSNINPEEPIEPEVPDESINPSEDPINPSDNSDESIETNPDEEVIIP